ncbi:hypothetical protein ACSPAH_14385 [Buttiauxella agrestis]
MKTRTKLAIVILMMLSATAQAACEYIIYPYTGANSQFGSHRLSSASDGKADSWWGNSGADAKNGQLTGVSKSIDVSSNNIFQPPGTVLAAAGAFLLPNMRTKVGGTLNWCFSVVRPIPQASFTRRFPPTGMTPMPVGMKRKMYRGLSDACQKCGDAHYAGSDRTGIHGYLAADCHD